MQKRDYLMDEIHRIGKIIADLLLSLKNEPNPENIILTQNIFLDKLNFSIEDLIEKNEIELYVILKNSNFTFEQIENIAEYLIHCAEAESEEENKLKDLNTARFLLNYINTESQSISFVRIAFEEKINMLLTK